MTFRKLIVWMAEEEGATKNDAQEKLCQMMMDSGTDFGAKVIATDERRVDYHCLEEARIHPKF